MAHRRFRVATQGAAAHDKVATRHCECCVRNARVRDDDSSKGRPQTSYLPMRHSSAVRLRRSPQSLIYACTMGALTAVVLACDHNASTYVSTNAQVAMMYCCCRLRLSPPPQKMIDQRELFGFTLLPSCRASATQPCALCALLHSAIRLGFKRAVSSPCRSLRVVVIVMGGIGCCGCYFALPMRSGL